MEKSCSLYENNQQEIEGKSQETYYEQIAREIFYRVKEKEPINNSYFKRIIHLALEKEELKKYSDYFFNANIIRQIIIREENSRKIISPYYFGINGTLEKDLEGYDKDYYDYLTVTQRILKKIEYCKHLKSYRGKNVNSLESQILKNSYFKYVDMIVEKGPIFQKKYSNQLEHYQTMDEEYGHLAPQIRITLSDSYNAILEIGKLLEVDKINAINNIKLYNSLLKDYYFLITYQSRSKQEGEVSPTLYYLEKLAFTKKEFRDIKKISLQSEDIDVEERLRLGLPLTQNEIFEMQKNKRELERTLRLKK